MSSLLPYEKATSESVIAREKIPIDIWFEAFSWLTAKNLNTCSLVCKKWMEWANNETVWEMLCKRKFHVKDLPSPYKTWKLAYKTLYHERKRKSFSTTPPCRRFKEHTQGITRLLVKGNLLFSGSLDTTIKIWNIKTSECIHTLRGHHVAIQKLKVQGKLLFSIDQDDIVKMWNIESGKCIKKLSGIKDSKKGKRGIVNTFAIQTQKRLLFSAPTYCQAYYRPSTLCFKNIKIWNMKTGERVKELEGHRGGIKSLLTKDNRLFSGADDCTIKIWDIDTHKCIKTLQGHKSSIHSLQIQGIQLFSGDCDEIKVWYIDTGECMTNLHGHDGAIFSLQMHGNRLFSANSYSQKIWTIETGECKDVGDRFYPATPILVQGELLFNASGCGTDLGKIKIWDTKSLECINTLEDKKNSSPYYYVPPLTVKRNRLFCGFENGTITIWDFSDVKSHAPT